jgi:ATP-dependent Clp protease ATP-binding subunit ClpA
MLGNAQRHELGKVLHDASAEAGRLGDRTVGTEHLTLALLANPDSPSATALGVSLSDARKALQALDFAALSAVGIDAPEPGPAASGRHRIRLTPGAREVMSGMHKGKWPRPLTGRHVLIELLQRRSPDPAAELLDALDIDRARVHAELLAT